MAKNFKEQLYNVYLTNKEYCIDSLKPYHFYNEMNFQEENFFILPGRSLKFIIDYASLSFELYKNSGINYNAPKVETPLSYLLHDLEEVLLEDDQLLYIKAIEFAFKKHLELFDINEPFKFRSSFIFRIRKNDKRLATYLQNNIPLEIKNGKILKFFTSVTDISHTQTNQNYQLSFYNMKNKDEYHFEMIDKKEITKNEHSLILSKRELEILECVIKGLNTKQTAENLKISVETVNRHRKNMIKKNNKNNIIQLATEAFKKNLL